MYFWQIFHAVMAPGDGYDYEEDLPPPPYRRRLWRLLPIVRYTTQSEWDILLSISQAILPLYEHKVWPLLVTLPYFLNFPDASTD